MKRWRTRHGSRRYENTSTAERKPEESVSRRSAVTRRPATLGEKLFGERSGQPFLVAVGGPLAVDHEEAIELW